MWGYQARGQWHTRDVNIINNIIVGCGVGFGAPRKGGKLSNIQVSHNTILNSTEYAINLGLRAESTKIFFIENNLFASSIGGEMVYALGGEAHRLATQYVVAVSRRKHLQSPE